MKSCMQLYVRNSVEAVECYKRAFGAVLGYHEMDDDGTFFHAELRVGGLLLLGLSEKKGEPVCGNIMQCAIEFEGDKKALLLAYETLKEGGEIIFELGSCPWSECRADLVDRFGVFWYLTI